jgi:hypothetical protein
MQSNRRAWLAKKENARNTPLHVDIQAGQFNMSANTFPCLLTTTRLVYLKTSSTGEDISSRDLIARVNIVKFQVYSAVQRIDPVTSFQ